MQDPQYSLTSWQPLSKFGRKLTAQQIAYFAERKLWALVDEFASLKSDGLKGRTRRRQELVDGPPGYVLADAMAAPMSLHTIRGWCSQLGIDVSPACRDNHVVLRLSPLTSEKIRQMACGAITRSDTLHHRNQKPLESGLLCPTIYPDPQAEIFNWAYFDLGMELFADMWVQLPDQPDLSLCQWKWDVVPILPLAFRPLIQLDNGNYATHDINDLYRQLINRANRQRKLLELKAPETVITREQEALQSELLFTQANRYFTKRNAQLSEGRRLNSAVDMVLAKLLECHEKCVEWCSVIPALIDSEQEATHVVLPAAEFDSLRLSDQLPVWLCAPQSPRWCAAMPVRGTDSMHVSRSISDRLDIADEADVEVHRPITASGQRETLEWIKLGGQPSSPTSSLPTLLEVDGWQEDDGERKFLQRLVALTRDGGEISLASGAGYLLGGTGRCVGFA